MELKLLLIFVMAMMALSIANIHNDPAGNQILIFKEKTSLIDVPLLDSTSITKGMKMIYYNMLVRQGPVATMTTSAGAPIDYDDANVSLNKRLIFHEFFMDSMTHLVRERIPERVVHANGAGAFGYFEVTHDVTDICKAKFLNTVGKRTPIAVRFSPVVIEKGGRDTSRDARGFAIKFYTEDGNFDIVGFNMPMYVYKDPLLFPTFVRAQKRNPATNVLDPNMLWDFLTLHPESLHMFLLVFGDRGIPNGYRHMPGFGIHTFQVVNEAGEAFFVRFHFKPDMGIKSLTASEARKIAFDDPDYNTRDLYRAIGEGNYPSWTASIQVLTKYDVDTAGFDVFDVTKTLPLDKYPLRPFGRFVLDKNPSNYFAEIEQLAFGPGNLVPGIPGAPDKVFEARRLAYRDAQYHRLGANFINIPVNCPFNNKAFAYNRDGSPPVDDNLKDIPNYYPNSFNGPMPYNEINKVEVIEIYQDQPNNFDQARDLYNNEMTTEERQRAIENILYSIGPAASFIQDRAVQMFSLIHSDLGERIMAGLQANKTSYNYN